ncbi:DUF1906 domain-containing protein [Paenibacillus flagellatus]|uniref:Rv2525c-like glycoside hydrolase-like domain-containing protein n=1 Tax=Paenibacillus flagellatus TaxID=2211139 RepID=A0A2V5KXB0_9BACL|nr:DUF1906 domain-containing protein [Paenibacillus flagellatus]PYI57007.1 hypothetical protein DLM86_00735 [Paenibacillus flagellatus]
MAKGFDCATPLTAATAAAFRRDGFAFVCRYLTPVQNSWKRLTREEADRISAAGLQIVSVFETTADRALGGRAAGLTDGAAALQLAAELGQPAGSAIYFAVDFDATAAQMPTVIEYIRACSEATPGYPTGVYGSFAVIEAVKGAAVCSRYWQTYAWSRGRKADGIHIYQYKNDVTVNGIGIDYDESYGSEGWWNTFPPAKSEPPVVKPPEPLFDAPAAAKVISVLGALYGASADEQVRQAAHFAASALRKEIGIPYE